MKGFILRNLYYTIFYVKTNMLQDFHICISVNLKSATPFFPDFYHNEISVDRTEAYLEPCQSLDGAFDGF